MKKLIIFTACLMLCLFLDAQALTGTYSGGTGTPGDPAQISSVADLLELAATTDDYAEHFILTTDLDLSGQSFTSAVIAKDTDIAEFFQGVLFQGTFDGNGHTISNLTIDASAQSANDYLGLFGYIEGPDAGVRDLTLTNISINTGGTAMYVGGLCGSNNGEISGCTVSGTITTGTDSEINGGLCGHNLNLITNCQSSCSLTVGDSDSASAGGLCGQNEGFITDSSASGTVSGGTVNTVGGLCGFNDGGTITNCAASGDVTGGTAASTFGGLVGSNTGGTLAVCRASGAVTAHESIGGLCGYNSGQVTQCYATGSITMAGDEGYGAGGLIGENGGSANECYSIGALTLPPLPWEPGGLIGADDGGSVSASFWNTETSGQTTSAGGTGLTTTQMQTQSIFTASGWDFSNVWKMDGFPVHLSAEPPVVQVVSIQVGGPISVEEETTEEYGCMAFYTDGSSNDVTQTADWSVIPTNYASISTNGLLTALNVTTDRTVNVQAVYTDSDGSYTDALEIVIGASSPEPASVVISGSLFIAENSTDQYTCSLLLMDGSRHDITRTVDWSVTPSNAASINASGVLTAAGVSTSLTANVQAVYTDTNGSYTNTLEIFIINDEGFYSGGTGSAQAPYLIANKTDLLTLRGNTANYTNYFALTADIDLAGEVFTNAVIAPNYGIYDDYSGISFRGSFDGQGHVISNLTIHTVGLDANNFLGLFGLLGTAEGQYEIPGAPKQIRNLNIENVSISSGESAGFIGGLVGQNAGGLISGCKITGTISGGNNSEGGGLCGENTTGSIISNCQAIASVLFDGGGGGLVFMNAGTLLDSSASCVVVGGGGLVRYNASGGQILSCHSSGSVSGAASVGGLCGKSLNNTVISNCYSSCSVSGAEFVGGLCGEFSGTIIVDSYATGDVNISGSPDDGWQNYGGLVGGCYGTVTRCYATGNIITTNSISYAGGFCGIAGYGSTFENCYATGDITISDETYSQIGGFCGGTYGDIRHCYSIGSLNLGTSLYRVGGFLGEQPYGSDLVEECFWDTDTSGLTNSAGGTGKTTAEMQAESTFTAVGWDFSKTWYMHGYPELQALDTVEKTDYLTWAANEGIPLSERGSTDTPAGDGIPNILKYVAGLPAMTPATPADIMSIAAASEDGMFSITYTKSKTAEGAELLPVWAGALDSSWIPEGITHELIETDGDVETWKVSIPLSTQGFMRLQVSVPK